MFKRTLSLLVVLLLLASTALAQQPNYYIEMPPGWGPEYSNLDENLLQDYYSQDENAMVQVYAWATEPLDLTEFADAIGKEMLNAGMPFTNMLASSPSQTKTGVSGLVREYTGRMDGANLHSLVIFSHHAGYMYMVLGMWDESAAQRNQPQVYAALDSFGFPQSLQGQAQPYGQPAQPQPYGQQGGQMGQPGGQAMGQPGSSSGTGGTGGTGTAVAGLKDRAWEIEGNMAAEWGKAHGSLNAGGYGVWELTSTRSVGLHFRDPYKQGKQSYSVEIVDKPSGKIVWSKTVGMIEKVRVGPGHFQITVRSTGAYAGWTCDWE